MVNAELTDIDKEIFTDLPQLYDLVEMSSTQCIKIAREEETRPYGVKENAMLTGEETADLIEALSKCDELFINDEINSVPDGIALYLFYNGRRFRKGEDPSLQKSLLDTSDFCVEKLGVQLDLTVYFSKNCWLVLHALDVKRDNTKGWVAYRWPTDKRFQGRAAIELTEELQNVFVLAQDIVMKKAMNGELVGIAFNNG